MIRLNKIFILAATCSDSLRNQDETDVDCGGTVCTKKCASGKSCSKASDCTSGTYSATTKKCSCKNFIFNDCHLFHTFYFRMNILFLLY